MQLVQHRFGIAAASAAFIFGLAHAGPARADLISDWNAIAIDEIKAQGGALAGPNPATRTLAIVHLAIYDTVAAFEKSHVPYLVDLDAPEDASVEAAVAGAAYYSLAVLLPARRTALNRILDAALDEAPGAPDTIDSGYDFGVEVADRILASRADDGSSAVKTDTGSSTVGRWRPVTAAAADAALEPGWRYVRPFGIPSPKAFRPAIPPRVGRSPYIAAVEEVRALGGKASTATTTVTRTAEQTLIADFWRQATHIPFSAIARQIVNARDLTLEESARFFAHLAVALADSRIAAWDAKYEYDMWRPLHAIGIDAGSKTGTTVDPDWTPYLATPAHPDYPSGHSTTSAAAAAVLTEWFGQDAGFTVASDTLAGVARSFASFRQASEENGQSRIYGGIHYRFANEAGQALGGKVGHYVVERLFYARGTTPPGVDPDEDGGVPPFDGGSGSAGSGAPDAAVSDAGGRDAGNSAPDASRPDASRPTPRQDSGSDPDSGPPFVADGGDSGSNDDDGCSCSAPGSANGNAGLRSLALIALALMLVRRRSDRR